MRRRILIWTITLLILMLVFPWLTVTFAGCDGMGISFILFFVVYPLFSVISGIVAGKEVGKFWMLPICTSVTFVLGTWLFFEMGEPAFILYGGIYLVVGLISMLLTVALEKVENTHRISWKKPVLVTLVILVVLVGIWIIWSGTKVDVQTVVPDKTP